MGTGVSGTAEDADVGEGIDGGLGSVCGDGGVVAVGFWLWLGSAAAWFWWFSCRGSGSLVGMGETAAGGLGGAAVAVFSAGWAAGTGV